MTLIVIGLGSNLGDRQAYITAAADALQLRLQEFRISSFHETPALLPEGAPTDWDKPFLNGAVAGETEETPQDWLHYLKSLEEKLGRKNRGRWGPREIDLDILAYGDRVLNSESLTLPHPGLLQRDFALRPLMEVAPHWRYPVQGEYYGMTAQQLVQHYDAARRHP